MLFWSSPLSLGHPGQPVLWSIRWSTFHLYTKFLARTCLFLSFFLSFIFFLSICHSSVQSLCFLSLSERRGGQALRPPPQPPSSSCFYMIFLAHPSYEILPVHLSLCLFCFYTFLKSNSPTVLRVGKKKTLKKSFTQKQRIECDRGTAPHLHQHYCTVRKATIPCFPQCNYDLKFIPAPHLHQHYNAKNDHRFILTNLLMDYLALIFLIF